MSVFDYRCYPTPARFRADFGEKRLRQCLRHGNEELVPAPVAVSLRIPPLARGNGDGRAFDPARYCAALIGEIRQVARLIDTDRPVLRVVWETSVGASLDEAEILAVRGALREAFGADTPEREYLLVEDAMTPLAPMAALATTLGLEHLLLRLDCAETSRCRSGEDCAPLIESVRAHSDRAGLRPAGIELHCRADEQVCVPAPAFIGALLALEPDRFVLRGAYPVPPATAVSWGVLADPPPALARAMAVAREVIAGAGYLDLGLEEFAHPRSALGSAFLAGQAHYTMHGFSTRPDYDHIGLGAGALSRVGDSYALNEAAAPAYCRAVALGHLPVIAGVELTVDDQMRRDVIGVLAGRGRLQFAAIEARYEVDFPRYFQRELGQLARLAGRDWVELEPAAIAVTRAGRRHLRALCALFDRYLAGAGGAVRLADFDSRNALI